VRAQCIICIGERQILTGGFDHVVKSFDAEELQLKKTFKEKHSREITCMLWTGDRLWVGSLDKTLTIWA